MQVNHVTMRNDMKNIFVRSGNFRIFSR